jgi:hypothetical protein
MINSTVHTLTRSPVKTFGSAAINSRLGTRMISTNSKPEQSSTGISRIAAAARNGMSTFREIREKLLPFVKASRIGQTLYLHPSLQALMAEEKYSAQEVLDFLNENFTIGLHGTNGFKAIEEQLKNGRLELIKDFFWTKDVTESTSYAKGEEPIIVVVELPGEKENHFNRICLMHAKHYIAQGYHANVLAIFKKNDKIISKDFVNTKAMIAAKDAFVKTLIS